MRIYPFAIGGLLLGSIVGWSTPLHIPSMYSHYTSLAVLTALDAVFGGSRAALERVFDLNIFITGWITNMVIAVVRVYIGDLVGINLYYVALIGFGLRVFINLAAIRKIIMTKRL